MVIVDASSDECVSSASSTQSFVRVSATTCCVLLEGRAVLLMSVSMSESSSINSVSTILASLSFRLFSSTSVSRANSFSFSFRRMLGSSHLLRKNPSCNKNRHTLLYKGGGEVHLYDLERAEI